MRVMISQPVTGMSGANAAKDLTLPDDFQGVAKDNKLFPYVLLEKARLNPQVISTVIKGGKYCVQGRFTYITDTRELISNSIYIESTTSGEDREWSFCRGEKSEKVNPFEECKMAQDKARYVNEASRIFVQMRDALSRGLLKIAYTGQLNEVEYLLDSLGRYEIVNFNELPIAAIYAIACSAIF